MLSWARLKYFLNKNQSIKYQIMIILMEEHRKGRFNKEHIGSYDGGNILLFDNQSWEKMKEKICKFLPKRYTMNGLRMENQRIFGLFSNPGPYCRLTYVRRGRNNPPSTLGSPVDNGEQEIEEIEAGNVEDLYIQFEITDDGYSYQYNGYKRSSDKLQKTANNFLLVTIFYYFFSWTFLPLGKVFTEFSGGIIEKIQGIQMININIIPTVILCILICTFIYKNIFDN